MDGNATFHASNRLATIVAVLTLTFGLSAPQSQAAGVWTNEPAGASVVQDCSFSGPPSACGILDVYSSSIQDTDSTATASPSGVIRSTLNAGNDAGGMQIGWSPSQIANQMYVGMVWRTNPQFNCFNIANKMWFMRGPGTNGFFGLDCGSGDRSAAILFGHNTGGLDNSHTCQLDLGLVCRQNVNGLRITLGAWTKLEAYIKRSTTATSRDGIVRWWINGVLVGDYSNLNYPAGLNEWVWTETWGGVPAAYIPTVAMSHYLDHLHISIPGGSTSADQPPGPPASPAIRSVVTP